LTLMVTFLAIWGNLSRVARQPSQEAPKVKKPLFYRAK
jgi:hypothetical protein